MRDKKFEDILGGPDYDFLFPSKARQRPSPPELEGAEFQVDSANDGLDTPLGILKAVVNANWSQKEQAKLEQQAARGQKAVRVINLLRSTLKAPFR